MEQEAEPNTDVAAMQTHKSPSINVRPSRRKRGSGARRRIGKQGYRPLAGHVAILSKDPESSRAAIRDIVIDGLLRKPRRARDPNRVEIYLPPSFSSLPSVIYNMESSPVSEPDSPPESFSPPPFKSWTASASTKSTASSVDFFKDPVPSSSLVSISPWSILGAGRLDPFANYPIRMSRAENWLIDQMNTGEDPALWTLRNCWLPVAIRYPATFHQFLANLALNVSRAHGETTPGTLVASHHSHAIQLMNHKLRDPAIGIMDDTVSAVIALVSYGILTGDFEKWKVHLEGLHTVVQARGGYETLENDLMLNRLIFCVDISGASRQDLKPRFPYPSKMLQEARESVNNLDLSTISIRSPPPWRQWFHQTDVLQILFDDLSMAVQYTKSKRDRGQVWRQVTFIIHWIDPILHRLLNMDQKIDRHASSSIIEEACRLGILLFLGEVRRKCGVMRVSTIIYVAKLKALLSENDDYVDWTTFHLLRLWLLFFGMLESRQQPEANWYADSVSVVAEKLKIVSWDDLLSAVKSFLWFEEIFDSEIEKFRADALSRQLFLGRHT